MVDFVVWGMADPLTVEQAAYLWAGLDPPTSSVLQPERERAATAPFLQMLTGAIASGELQADSTTNPNSFIGHFEKSLLTRADLMAFAGSRGQRPAFLFDTMLKSASSRSKGKPAPKVINKGGRPPEWDWDSFYFEIVRIADTPDGLPDTQAELAEMLRKWFINKCDDHPGKTTLEDRIRPIYQYVKQTRKPEEE